MNKCSEITIYRVSKVNIPRVIELSLAIIDEINTQEQLITSYEILKKTDNDEELCWRLTWINKQAVKLINDNWSSLPSAKELMSLVKEKIYYGHFIDVV